MSFLSFAYAWQMSDEIVIAQIYSTAWATLISSRCSRVMFKLEWHVDLSNGKRLSKQSRKGRRREEGLPAGVAGSATTPTECRVVRFQGLGDHHKLRTNSIDCSRKWRLPLRIGSSFEMRWQIVASDSTSLFLPQLLSDPPSPAKLHLFQKWGALKSVSSAGWWCITIIQLLCSALSVS